MHTIQTVDRLDPPIPSNVTAILCVRDDESACRRGLVTAGPGPGVAGVRVATGVEPAGGGAPLRESARSALAGTMAAASQRPAGGRHGAVGARHWRVGPRVHTVRSRLASGLAARLLGAPHRRRPRSAVSQEAQRRQRAVASVKPGAARCFTRAAPACCLRSAIDAPCLSRARPASPPPQLTHRSVCASVCRAAASTAASILFCSWDPGAACAYCSPCNRRT